MSKRRPCGVTRTGVKREASEENHEEFSSAVKAPRSLSLAEFLHGLDRGISPQKTSNRKGKKPAKRRKTEPCKPLKRYPALARQDSLEQREEVAQISSDSSELSDIEEVQLPDTRSCGPGHVPWISSRTRPSRSSRGPVKRTPIPANQGLHGNCGMGNHGNSATFHAPDPGSMKVSAFLGEVRRDLEEEQDENLIALEQPSSSELEGTPEPAAPALTASGWLREQHLLQQQGPLQDEPKQTDTPSKFSSTKKKSRYVKGGLAERLKQLSTQEKSDISFWDYSQKKKLKGSDAQSGNSERKSVPLKVEVKSAVSCCSLVIADCGVINDVTKEGKSPTDTSVSESRSQLPGDGLHGTKGWIVCRRLADSPLSTGRGGSVKVFFTVRAASSVQLGVGSSVHIFPPWYECRTPLLGGSVAVFGAHFSVGIAPSRSPLLKPDHQSKTVSKPRALFQNSK